MLNFIKFYTYIFNECVKLYNDIKNALLKCCHVTVFFTFYLKVAQHLVLRQTV